MLVRYDNVDLAYARLGRLLFAMSVLALSVATYLQYAWSLNPCSLCIGQRYAFLFIGVAGALLFSAPRGLQLPAMGLATVAAVGGLGLAARNLWVQLYPSPSCGMDALANFLNELPWVSLWPGMFEATGMCSDVIPNVLGVSFPGWALLGFAVTLMLLCARILRKCSRRMVGDLPFVNTQNPC